MAVSGSRETFRFRDFVLDLATYELRRNGHRVRLERQPMDLLILLVARRGQLVSRTEIADALWGKDVFVDVENGVNTAVRDSSERAIRPMVPPSSVGLDSVLERLSVVKSCSRTLMVTVRPE